jgi:hypothetical protein
MSKMFKNSIIVSKNGIGPEEARNLLFDEESGSFKNIDETFRHLEPAIEAELKETKDFVSSNSSLKAFYEKDPPDLPLFADFQTVLALRRLNGLLKAASVSDHDVFFFLLTFYHLMGHELEIETNVKSLLTDIRVLKEISGANEAADAAFLVGRTLANKQATTLLLAVDPDRYPLIAPKVGFSLKLSDYAPKSWKIKDLSPKPEKSEPVRKKAPGKTTDETRPPSLFENSEDAPAATDSEAAADSGGTDAPDATKTPPTAPDDRN